MKLWKLVVGLVVLVGGASAVYAFGTKDSVSFTLKRAERISVGSGEELTHKYLVFTEEGEVFENTDTLFYGKWNSSDIYGKLTVGSKYKATVYGWRIPFLSTYRNIIAIE